MAPAAKSHTGFTLIELMVVLIIMALMSALVLPKFPAIYEKFLDKGDRDAFNQSLAALGTKAYSARQSIVLTQDNLGQWLDIPSGWEVKIKAPIVYKANGFCLGGQLSYRIKEVEEQINLAPPYCQPNDSSSGTRHE